MPVKTWLSEGDFYRATNGVLSAAMKHVSARSATAIASPRCAGPRDWGLLALLTAAMMFSIVDRVGIAVLIDPIKADLRIDDAAFGLFNGVAFGLVYSAMGVPFGWLADRWSRKSAIILGIVIWSLATAACGLAGGFWAFLLPRLFVGAGEAGLAPAAYGILHDRFGRGALATVIGILQMGSALGSGVALLVTSAIYGFFLARPTTAWPLIGALHPWQSTFIAIAAPGIVFILAILSIRDRRMTSAVARSGETLTLRRELARAPALYGCLFGGMAAMSCLYYALLSWMPAMLVRDHGWSIAAAGRSYGLIMIVAGPAGLLCGGAASDLLTARGYARAHSLVPLIAASVVLPAAIGVRLAGTAAALLAAAGIANFALFLTIGIAPAYLQRIAPSAVRARMSALYVSSNNIVGLGVASILIGLLSARQGSEPANLGRVVGDCCVACAVVAIGFFILLHRRSACGGPA